MLSLPIAIYHDDASNKSWLEKARAANWQIDASALASFDSSALALLLDIRRAALAAGSALGLHNVPARLTQLATLYGVNDLII